MSERKKIAIIFLLSFILFSAAAALRWWYYDIPGIIGTPTYFHERIAGYMAQGNFSWYDSLSFGGREYTYPPLLIMAIAGTGLVTGIQAATVIVIALSGAFGMVFFYLIAKRYVKDAALFLLATTPGIITLYSHLSTRSFSITLGLAALYVIIRYRKFYLAGVILGISSLAHPEPAVFFSIIIFLYLYSNKVKTSSYSHRKLIRMSSRIPVFSKRSSEIISSGNVTHDFSHGFVNDVIPSSLHPSSKVNDFRGEGKIKNFAKMGMIAIAIGSIWYAPFIMSHGLPQYNEMYNQYKERRYSLETPDLNDFFWEFAGIGSLTIIVAACAVLGFRKSEKFFRLSLLFSLALALIAQRFMEYIPFFMAIPAAIFLGDIRNRKARIILMAIVFFTASVFALQRIDSFAKSYPIKNQTDAFLWIKNNTPPDSVILSDWQWGHWISGIAERKNFLDGYAEYAPDIDKRLSELAEFEKNCKIPEGYNIKYVFIEKWWIEKRGIQCVYNYTLAYSNEEEKVFRV